MKTRGFLAVALAVFAFGCGNEGAPGDTPQTMSRQPVSVRGWIEDVAGAQRNPIPDMEIARRQEQFINTSVWVEGTQFASGGVAENGAFLVLDVPPGNATLGFQAPGADNAQLIIQNVPGSADVFVPGILLKNGAVTIVDPKALQVRVPSDESEVKPTGQTAIIAGHPVPVMAHPLQELANRREYPNPGGIRPVATVK